MRLLDSTRTTYGTKISDRIWKDSNGQLICRDCIIARTGIYDYLESEIIEGGDRNKIVKVFRTDDEVFDPTSIASFENKPFVDDHPQENVSLVNYKDLAKGYMYNVRRGEDDNTKDCLICDLVVTDADTIEEILSGDKRELSLGYDTVIVDKGGEYYMTKIRGNHLALVEDGRAGCATIRDSAEKINKLGGTKMSKKKVRLFDEDIFEVEEIPEDVEVKEDIPQASEDAPVAEQDEEPTLAEIKKLLMQVIDMLTVKEADEEPAVKEEVAPEQPIEVKTEEEVVGDEDITEEVATETEDCGGKLLDADEISEETTVTTKDSKTVYSKFAKMTDAQKVNTASSIEKSFQDRYNRAASK